MKWTNLMVIATMATLSACAQNHSIEHQKIEHIHPAMQHAHMKGHPSMTHTLISPYSFDETVNKLQTAVQSKGMTVFAVIDHTDAAKKAGLTMQPAKVIVFGTPKVGTPLMVKDPALALQLPLRVLVTQVNGQVQVIFNDTRAVILGSQIEYREVENTLANAEKLIRATLAQ